MATDTEFESSDTRSAVPEPISRLIDRMSRNLQEAPTPRSRAFSAEAIDSTENTVRLLRSAQRTIEIASDLRSLITAYAHAFQKPRPSFSDLAAAQGISSTGIRRRYTGQTVEAIRQLVSEDPELEAIFTGFPSLESKDLVGISPSIDRALNASGFTLFYNPPEVDSITAAQPFLVDLGDGIQSELPVSLVESHAAESQQTPAHALLGEMVAAVRGSLNSAEWQDAWVQTETRARLEWAGGIQMEQFLAKIVPFYGEYPKEPQNLISGVHALRVIENDSKTASIEWYVRPQVSLFVTRYPKSQRSRS